jgi:hypothetical protein
MKWEDIHKPGAVYFTKLKSNANLTGTVTYVHDDLSWVALTPEGDYIIGPMPAPGGFGHWAPIEGYEVDYFEEMTQVSAVQSTTCKCDIVSLMKGGCTCGGK